MSPNPDAGVPPTHSPLAERVLAHHAYQGATNDCGPCCIAMVVNAVARFPVQADAIGRLLERPVRHGLVPVPRRWPRSATFPWGVTAMLRSHGFRAHWRLGAREAELRQAIAAGVLPLVIVGGWRPAWAHWLVVLGWDARRGWAVADPAVAQPRQVWIPNPQFRRRWGRYGRQVVLANPGRPPAPR